MLTYTGRDGVPHYVSSLSETWATLFGSTAMSSFPNPVDSYHAAGTSSLTTEWYDVGVSVSAQWTAVAPYTDDSGAATVYVDLSPDGVTGIVSTSGGSAKGTARFVRVRYTTTGAMTIAGMPSITITASPRSEPFAGHSSASVALTVTLQNKYFALQDISFTVQGTTPYVAMPYNVVLSPSSANSFDVRVFDQSNAQVAVDFTGTFYGISY